MNKREKQVIQHQLDAEKEVVKDLERQYQAALNQINEKIRILQSDELTQSRIYQIQYQKALKGQVQGIIDKLHGDEYSTLQQYLHNCYTDAFVGTMYNLHGQGMPLILPIDQKAAVKAILTDSKISEGLYESLGVDAQKLKKTISSEITRGIASNLSYAEIARNISNVSKAPLSRAKSIANTEGHRIQQASTYDAQNEAKAKGADVVKQWDASLDGDTRPTHRKLDGQIREIDEPYEADGKKAMFPGDFGDPAEDCRCRCVSLTRARAALDADELKTLKDRAEYFGLDKSKSFEDFKKKYLNTTETLKSQGKNGIIYSGGVLDNFSRKMDLTTSAEDVKAVNPNYDPKKYQWSYNCQRCVSAYEMRRRGYDVVAKPIPAKIDDDDLASWFELAWNNADRKWCMSGSGKKQVEEYMKSWGDGARAVVGVGFNSVSGHVFIAEQVKGKTVYLDPQNGSLDCSEYFKRAVKSRTHVTRIDNLTPSDRILDCCEDRR